MVVDEKGNGETKEAKKAEGEEKGIEEDEVVVDEKGKGECCVCGERCAFLFVYS